jgi:hypothetical protein
MSWPFPNSDISLSADRLELLLHNLNDLISSTLEQVPLNKGDP